jgi:hypothetical protein
MNDMLINGLATIGAIACLTWLAKGIKSLTAASQPEPEAPSNPAQTLVASNPVNADIAVIAAAVTAMLGAARIVRIAEAGLGHRWAADGRWMHQNSHSPH